MTFRNYDRLNRIRRCVPFWRSSLGWLPDAIVNQVQETGWLFVHVPKTGGISVSEHLYGLRMPHRLARDVKFYHPVLYARSRTIAAVRDPIDRFLSAFDYLKLGGMERQDRDFAARHVRPYPCVAAFVEALEDRALARPVFEWLHFRPQTDFVCERGICIVDDLIPFHSLAAEVQRLLPDRGPVPARNVTPGPRSSRNSLGRRAMALLRATYANDEQLFAYASERRRQGER